jgi:hypothetical protein
MMEDAVVQRRAWLTREQFLDYLGAINPRRPWLRSPQDRRPECGA